MRKKAALDHLLQYLLLTSFLVAGILILRFVNSIYWKTVLIFTLGSFYFGYGSFHHFHEKSLKLATVLEYALISVLIVISLLVVFG